MSDINEIQSIVIVDNKSVSSYAKMIDSFKPKDAKKCLISVSKFEATYELPDNYALPSHNLALFISGSENTYTNQPSTNIVLRSQLVDTFMTSQIVAVGDDKFALYHTMNQTDHWIKIAMSDLNDLRLFFKTSSVLSDYVNNVSFSNVPQFAFFLHLRVKFE